MFEINKRGTIQIGNYYNNYLETNLYLSGNKLNINSESNDIQMKVRGIPFSFKYDQTQMYINNGINNTIIEHGYKFNFDENRDFLIQKPKKQSSEVVNRLFFLTGLILEMYMRMKV
jgi:hypothetical protein